jgi:hypothetical protein
MWSFEELQRPISAGKFIDVLEDAAGVEGASELILL